MIGMFDHDRSRSMMEEPSRSGRPRSRMMRSGGLSVAERIPSSASRASCTANPSNSKAARRNCLIWSSSSMTRMVALPIVAHREIRCFGLLRGQTNGHERPTIGTRAERVDLPAIRSHECLRDPQTKTRSGDVRCPPLAAEEAFPQTRALLSHEADTLVLDREYDRVALGFSGNGDRGTRLRILRRVVHDLPQCLFEQDGIDVDKGQFDRNIQEELVAA